MKFIVVSEVHQQIFTIEADSVSEHGETLRFYKKTGRFRRKMIAKIIWVTNFYPKGTEVVKQ